MKKLVLIALAGMIGGCCLLIIIILVLAMPCYRHIFSFANNPAQVANNPAG